MSIEQSLDHVANRYRAQGYKVVVGPGPADLPDFAKDFKVEIVAERNGGGVLASAKKSPSELEANREIPRYAEVTGNQPDWRFDIFVLGPEGKAEPNKIEAAEPTEADMIRVLADIERMRRAGFAQQSFIAAWAVLETAMRKRMQAEGEEAGRGSSPRTLLNELYSSGMLNGGDFRDLERLYQARNVIVHGFSPPEIQPSAVQFLVDTARRLLEESHPAKQSA